MERDTEDYIMQLEKRLVLLEGRVAMLEARLAGMTPVPTRTVSPTLQQNCPVCGITFIDSLGRPIALGYACNRNGCPSGVTHMSKQQTQNLGTVWADTDAKGSWTGLNVSYKLEPHLNQHDIQYEMPLSIDSHGSTTSYAWDPISQGNKKI